MFAHRQGRGGFVVLVGLLVVLVGAPASHAQTKKKNRPDYKVMIFDDEFNRGKNVIVRQDVADMEFLKFNDKSESLKWNLAPGRAAILFDEKNFDKPVLILVGEGDVMDLGKQQPNALHSVSSIGFVPCKKGAYPKGLSRDIPKVGTE